MAVMIQFYHLISSTRERAVPKLMEKALASGARVVIQAGREASLRTLSEALWTQSPATFLPHGWAGEAHADQQPILLTLKEENPNGASILCLLDGVMAPQQPERYSKILDIFDGANEAELHAARARWSDYKTRGWGLQYVQQQSGGGWKIEHTVAAA